MAEEPYFKKNPGDLIRSKDWNDLQITLRTEVVTVQQTAAALQAALQTVQQAATATTQQVTGLQTAVASAAKAAPTQAKVLAIMSSHGPYSQTALDPGSEFDIAHLRFGIRVDFDELPDLDAMALRRLCEVQVLVPYPLGANVPFQAPDSFGLQWLTVRAGVTRVGNSVVWTANPVELFRLGESIFASMVRNSHDTRFQARLIVHADFIGSTTEVPGRITPNFVAADQLGVGEFEVPFRVTVPVATFNPYTFSYPHPYWPWSYTSYVGNFQGIGGGLL
ncbi:hypothetical protein ACNOYE_05905 [Nannocystaceae bacterium ST9]